MKKIKYLIVIISVLMLTTGCVKFNFKVNSNPSNPGNKATTTKVLDHEVYKYIKISSKYVSNLLYSAGKLFNDPYYLDLDEVEYRPTLMTEYDQKNGKATKAELYIYFSNENDANEALDKFNESSSQNKKNYKNTQVKKLTDDVYYIYSEMDLNGYEFTQFISTYLLYEQDVKKYKEEIYYSRLYNYESNPPVYDEGNIFEETLEGIRIEYSNKKIDLVEKNLVEPTTKASVN